MGSHEEESPRVAEKEKGDGILRQGLGGNLRCHSGRRVNLHLPKSLQSVFLFPFLTQITPISNTEVFKGKDGFFFISICSRIFN